VWNGLRGTVCVKSPLQTPIDDRTGECGGHVTNLTPGPGRGSPTSSASRSISRRDTYISVTVGAKRYVVVSVSDEASASADDDDADTPTDRVGTFHITLFWFLWLLFASQNSSWMQPAWSV
jgi:hypothetical protein